MPKMYKEADGQWVVPGKQSRKAERVDIPSGSAELADWLNINARPYVPDVEDGLSAPSGVSTDAFRLLHAGVPHRPRDMDDAGQPVVDEERNELLCAPHVQWKPAPPIKLWSAGDEVDGMIDRILELDGHALGNVAGAVTERISQLTKALG